MIAVLTWLGALLPIATLFILMSGVGLKTDKAAGIAALIAIPVALFVGGDTWLGVGVNILKGIWNAVPILLVIWTAIILYQILEVTGSFKMIQKTATSVMKDELFRVLFFAWLFSSFLQGITGFGVPVAVCTPILIALGVKPRWAVVVTLLGHAWGNTFGTFAMAWDAAVAQSGITDTTQLILLSAAFLWFVDMVGSSAVCFIYGGKKAFIHMLPLLLIMSVIHGAGQMAVAFLNSTIACFIPTTIALGAALLLLKMGMYNKEWSLPSKIMKEKEKETVQKDAGIPAGLKPVDSIFPFIILAGVSVLILMVPFINKVVYAPVIQWTFPETATSKGFVNAATTAYGPLHIFTHASFILLLTVLITWFTFMGKKLTKWQDLSVIWSRTLKKTIPTSIGLLLLVVMAQILRGSGMIYTLAKGVADVAGVYYGAASPLVGVLGAFITSSNTSSNILFGSFQASAAEILMIPSWILVAAQTAGGAMGTVVGPSTVYLGMTTAGCQEQAGWALKKVLPIVLMEAIPVGIVVLLLSLGIF